ncbi:hypothetical protein M2271_007738 [Streptomyces sp. LBL]|nr:hypothetical protein [Streptomyces sp. LBL]MDH6629889.1 hypothetical protein [Streptomyces sp. LBL]
MIVGPAIRFTLPNLAVDETERTALVRLADVCDGWEVIYEPAS